MRNSEEQRLGPVFTLAIFNPACSLHPLSWHLPKNMNPQLSSLSSGWFMDHFRKSIKMGLCSAGQMQLTPQNLKFNCWLY